MYSANKLVPAHGVEALGEPLYSCYDINMELQPVNLAAEIIPEFIIIAIMVMIITNTENVKARHISILIGLIAYVEVVI